MSFPKEAAISVRKHTKEIITPHRLTIAILIRTFFNFRDSAVFKHKTEDSSKVKYRRDFCILTLRLAQNPDLTLEELHSLLTSKVYHVHPFVIKAFDATLRELNSVGVESLLDVVDKVKALVKPPLEDGEVSRECVSRTSVIGYYLRRLIISFEKLTFSEVTSVLQAFKRYYGPMRKIIEGDQLNIITSEKILQGEEWCADRQQWSRRQAELFIATQAALVCDNETKALSPNELQKRIRNVLKSNPDLAEAHFLSYLNYLRVREFCGAVNSLYHCFDRNAPITLDRISDEKSKGYRFAALNLAVLHYHFGHRNEALAALKEAIKISQEANDNVCLQDALSWLYCLNRSKNEKLIEHSIIKSLVLNLHYTMSLGIQSFVQYAGLTAGNPKQIFDTLTKSDLTNCEHGLDDLVSNSYAQKSSLWLFYGKTEMSLLWSQLLLNLDNGSGSGPKRVHRGEAFCRALCNVADHLIARGDYDVSHATLQHARELFPNEPLSHGWMLCENLLLFVRSLRKERWLEAENAAQKIAVVDEDESRLRLAELHLQRRDFVEAHRCVGAVLDGRGTSLRVDHRVRAMVLLAEIQGAAGGLPAGIVALLNSALAYAEEYHVDYLAAVVRLHVAHNQLLMGMPARALAILDRCLVQVLAHGGTYDRARALLLYVKCLVANSEREDASARKKTIMECVEMLGKIGDDFRKAEAFTRAKDTLYLQAVLFEEIGLTAERNRCAMEFRLQDEEFPSKNDYVLFNYL